jgi:hypothetical protein
MISISPKRAASLRNHECYLALQEWSETADPGLEVVKDIKRTLSNGGTPASLIPQFVSDMIEIGANPVDWQSIIEYVACGDYDIDAGV